MILLFLVLVVVYKGLHIDDEPIDRTLRSFNGSHPMDQRGRVIQAYLNQDPKNKNTTHRKAIHSGHPRYPHTARPLSEGDRTRVIENSYPNLPYRFWLQNYHKTSKYGCGKLANLFAIEWSGDLWQTYRTENQLMYLYSAYIDDREDHVKYVRVIASVKQVRKIMVHFLLLLYY